MPNWTAEPCLAGDASQADCELRLGGELAYRNLERLRRRGAAPVMSRHAEVHCIASPLASPTLPLFGRDEIVRRFAIRCCDKVVAERAMLQ